MLRISGLGCEKGDRPLFGQLSLTIAAGQLLLVAGPNGAGKTSFLRIIAGLGQVYEGKVEWDGQDIRGLGHQYTRNLLFHGHKPGIKLQLTAAENLQWFAARNDTRATAITSALQAVGLAGFEDIPAHQLSAGQQRRVALARLMLEPAAALWILDEPFTAIDQAGIAMLEQRIATYTGHGGMVIMTSHQLLAPALQDHALQLVLGTPVPAGASA